MRQCLVCGQEINEPTVRGRPVVVCSDRCRLDRKNTQREASRQRAVKRGCPPDKHGTCTGYTQYKCDCERCKGWARSYKQHRRGTLKAEAGASG